MWRHATLGTLVFLVAASAPSCIGLDRENDPTLEVLAGDGSQRSAISGQWSAVPTSLATARALFNSSLRAIDLMDGRVLFTGGATGNGGLAAVDLFSSGVMAPATSLSTARGMTAMVALADGGALVAGGGNATNAATAVTLAERWNAATGAWTPVGSLSIARQKAIAVLLSDGRVLVTGGENGSGSLSTAEVFNPATNAFAMTGSMAFVRAGGAAGLLPDGRVLVLGGGSGTQVPRAVETWSPVTGLFTTGPNLASGHLGTAGARLADGRIMIAAGCTGSNCSGPALAICEIYNPATNTISTTVPLNQGSSAHSMILLPTGKILLAGGFSNGSTTFSRAELYDPATNAWTVVGSLATARYDAAIALLPDGRALIAGGRTGAPMTATFLSSAEIYDPGLPTLCRVCQLDGTCTTLTGGTACDDGSACTQSDACQSGVCTGSAIACNAPPDCRTAAGATCNGSTGICSYPIAADGSTCSADSDACTRDVCAAGACTHPSLTNDCMGRACGASPSGCFACGTCPPGSGCNANGQCDSLCAGVSCAECQSCSAGVCAVANEGGACTSDGNACNGAEVCRSGQCVSGAAVSCASPPECHAAVGAICNTMDGSCAYPSLADGTPCTSDGDGCTQDVCFAGACTHPVIANDCGGAACGASPTGCFSCGSCSECQSCSSGVCVAPEDGGAACTSDGGAGLEDGGIDAATDAGADDAPDSATEVADAAASDVGDVGVDGGLDVGSSAGDARSTSAPDVGADERSVAPPEDGAVLPDDGRGHDAGSGCGCSVGSREEARGGRGSPTDDVRFAVFALAIAQGLRVSRRGSAHVGARRANRRSRRQCRGAAPIPSP